MILVSRRPPSFDTAANFQNECGAYQLQAALRAFGKDASIPDLYHSSLLRRVDWSLPWLMPSILRRHGIASKTQFLSHALFMEKIPELLAQNSPVLFVIRSIHGEGRLHWISAWGYDPATNEFLCYDSQAPAQAVPHGNTRYHTSLIASRLPWKGTFALIVEGETP